MMCSNTQKLQFDLFIFHANLTCRYKENVEALRSELEATRQQSRVALAMEHDRCSEEILKIRENAEQAAQQSNVVIDSLSKKLSELNVRLRHS